MAYFPQQEEFNPGESEERADEKLEKGRRVRRIVLLAGAVIVILGLIYFPGIYDAIFFSRTPSSLLQPVISPTNQEETLTVPVNLFTVHHSGPLNSERNEESVRTLVQNASNIWAQANIKLEAKRITVLEITDEQARQFYENPVAFAQSVPEFNPDVLNGFLTGTLSGINGVAFEGMRSFVVADYTAGSRDFRTFAHEAGHLLGLPHVSSPSLLMSQGAGGDKLTQEEIQTTRKNIEF